MNGKPMVFARRAAFHTALRVITVAAALVSVTARADCLPMPDPDMSRLDEQMASGTQPVLREAQARLRDLPPGAAPLKAAELDGLIAEASYDLGHTDSAMAAIESGLERLRSSRASPAVDRVRLRLELLRAELQTVSENGDRAGAAIDKLLPGLPDESLERACALSERAIAYDFNDEPDRAVNAALTGHRLAVDHGWSIPRIETAYTLAVNFRRAGLYENAEKMIDEVIALETAGKRLQNLTGAYYERGQLLVAMGRFAEARIALAKTKEYAIVIGDRLSETAANLPLCLAELNDHNLPAAESVCNTDSSDLIAANRLDLATLLKAYQARLDLEMHRPHQAIKKLDAILSGPVHRLLPVQEPRIYGDRALARSELHHYSDAFSDLAHAQALDAASGIEMRHRQVAVLAALIEAERLRADNHVLEAHLQHEQQDLLQQKRARLLWATVAATSGIVCVLLAVLALVRRRNSRRLRRYDIILNSAWSSAPHAMVMLDENRLVCFANRPLFGIGRTPAVGTSLVASIPPEFRSPVTQSIDTAFEKGRFQSLELVLQQETATDRSFEVLVLPAMHAGEAVGVALQCIDVTDLRAMERQFSDGNSHERLQLGSELHEGLAQELVGVLLMLSSLSKALQRESAASAHVATLAAEQLVRSIDSARRMAQDLAPVGVVRGSLADALRRLAESEAGRLGVSISCECVLDGCALSDIGADHIHQFCRNALLETVLVAHCRCVRMQLNVIDDSLVVRVIGSRAAKRSNEFPGDEILTRMLVFRARLLGGRLSLGPEGDDGFSITLSLLACQLANRNELTIGADRHRT